MEANRSRSPLTRSTRRAHRASSSIDVREPQELAGVADAVQQRRATFRCARCCTAMPVLDAERQIRSSCAPRASEVSRPQPSCARAACARYIPRRAGSRRSPQALGRAACPAAAHHVLVARQLLHARPDRARESARSKCRSPRPCRTRRRRRTAWRRCAARWRCRPRAGSAPRPRQSSVTMHSVCAEP